MTAHQIENFPKKSLSSIAPGEEEWRSFSISDEPTDDRLMVVKAATAQRSAEPSNCQELPNVAMQIPLFQVTLVFVAGKGRDASEPVLSADMGAMLRPSATLVLLQTDWHSACRLVEILAQSIVQSESDGPMYIDLCDGFFFAMSHSQPSRALRVGHSGIDTSHQDAFLAAADAAILQIMLEGEPGCTGLSSGFGIFRLREKPSRSQWSQLTKRLSRNLKEDGRLYMVCAIDASAAHQEELFLLML